VTRGQGPAVVAAAAFIAVIHACLLPCPVAEARPVSGSSLDARMVAEQVEARGVDDERVLEALRRVPRAAFVPPEVRWRAHDDESLPIGHGQTISQPYVVALMTSLLDVGAGQKVLEIGTGSGYQAAVLSLLAQQIYTVEIVPELATAARLRLTRQGLRNIHVKQGDGNFGWKAYGPYDRIIVTAAAAKIPEELVEQLVEGGVLIMPVGDPDAVQMLVRGVKRGGKLYAHPVRRLRFVPLTGAAEGAALRAPAARPLALSDPGRPAATRRARRSARRSDRRARLGERSRVAHGRAVRDGDRPCESGGVAHATGRCAREAG